MRAHRLRSSCLALLPFLAACIGACSSSEENPTQLDEAERWNDANNPVSVDPRFSVVAGALPLEGTSGRPAIPGDYWATFSDSINARWDGPTSLSPAEKYERAFNRPGVALAVSETDGIRGQVGRPSCSAAGSECDALTDGSSCAIPRGETRGRCIPGWWGICHGWAPFAIRESAPVSPVTRNGVTFYPGDLEALGSIVYAHGLPSAFLSERCNIEDAPRDANGRILASECRDMNPGSFHVLVTNMLGVRHEAFVYDLTAGDQVWNQPVYAYRVTNAQGGKLKTLTQAEAIALVGGELTWRTARRRAAVPANAPVQGVLRASKDGPVTLKTDGTGDVDLYVRKNAPASTEAFDCSSTTTTARESCRIDVRAGDQIHYTLVATSANASASVSVGTVASDARYTYDPAARGFYHVRMDVKYVSEAAPARTSHVGELDRYLHTSRLEYVLETDASGRILGGEWVGDSRTEHPDFAWWPTGAPTGSVARGLITYAEVKQLLDEAARPSP